MSDRDHQFWVSLPLPAVILGGEGRIVDINPSAEELLNSSSRSLSGHRLERRFETEVPLTEVFARVRESGAPVFMNGVRVKSEGRPPETCNLRVAPLVGQEGMLLLLITPLHLVERLHQADAARSSARSAVGMAEMLGHEIKNPLAGIAGAAQLLSMGLTGEDRELTDLIVEETRRIAALIDQVGQFGNLPAPSCRAVNLHDVLDRSRKTAGFGFAANMQFAENYDPSLPLAWVDPDQIQQVFLNLIRNASEVAGPEGGTITLRSFYDHGLRVRRVDGTGAAVPLQIEIADDGPGFAPGLLDQAFDPFVSGRENGTGLGLALVSKIMSDHDGMIGVTSVPGETRIRLSFPLAPQVLRVEE
ncbi:two-component system sensor histidine kinase NtrB [Palleronia caenipelagi]|uniref:histidine kinase n=1 Tax=Palleronia caenipelagi TaxID=2489174 RepID=A0A547PNK3_9RHOB|nr:ATP-binding protein [Palleronia caenipelagi]TRD15722.1 PAS domain-containing sensor histidine kinase [Palleronia caenipelagi]